MATPLVGVDAERFARGPMGRAWWGPTLMVWADSPRLVGMGGWGVVPLEHIDAAIAQWVTLWPRLEHGVAIVTDMSRFAPLLPETYQRFASYSREVMPAFAARGARQLVILPSAPLDVMRVVSAGFLTALGATHAHHVTSDVAAGAAWLDRPGAAERIAEVRAGIAAAEGTDALVRQVRTVVAEMLEDASPERVAQRLAMSSRTLQRALAAAGTSLREQVLLERVARAARLLATSDDKIAAVAAKVGFASSSHFASVFRRVHGVSPEAFRRRTS